MSRYTCAREPDRAPLSGRPRAGGRVRGGTGTAPPGNVPPAGLERRRDPPPDGPPRSRGRAGDDPLEPALQRRPRRLPAGASAGRGPAAGGLPPLPAPGRRAARRARLPAGPPTGWPGRGVGGGAARGVGHAVHGAHDGHGPAAQLPDAARHRLPARRRPGRAAARRCGPARGRPGARGRRRPRPRLWPRRLELVARDSRLRRDGSGARAGGPAAEALLDPRLRLGPGSRRGAAPRRPGDRRVGREGGHGVERGDRTPPALAVGAGAPRPRPRAAGPGGPAGAPRRGREGAGAPAGRPRRPARGGLSSSPSSWEPERVARCRSWAGRGRSAAPSGSRGAPARTSCATSTA